jgi:hypothetical protein
MHFGVISDEHLVAILHHGDEVELLMNVGLRPTAAEIFLPPDMIIERAGEGEAGRQIVFDKGAVVALIGAVIALGQFGEVHGASP